MRHLYNYTALDSRDLVHNGVFLETDDIDVGDFFLTHHVCGYTGERILEKCIERKIAMYFQDKPVYDLIVTGGSSYKSCLKHISFEDQIVRRVDGIEDHHMHFKYK